MAELGDVAVLAHRDAAGPADGGRPHRERRPRRDPVRPARQPGRRDGDLLRASCATALLAMSGATRRAAPRRCARASVDADPQAPGRTEYQRGIVDARAPTAAGRCASTGSQGSGILRSMSEANGLVVLGHAQGDVAAGEEVDVLLFDGLV